MTHLAPLVTNLTPALILFENDHSGRPHAGWFTSDELIVTERASGALGYVALRVTNEEEHALAQLLPRGDLRCDGQVHVPLLTPELVETLRALLFGNQHRPISGMASQHQRRHLPQRYHRPSLRRRA